SFIFSSRRRHTRSTRDWSSDVYSSDLDPAAPTNTWKLAGGVDYTFPQNLSLPGGGFLLLVNFDPVTDSVALEEFRARYNLGAGEIGRASCREGVESAVGGFAVVVRDMH